MWVTVTLLVGYEVNDPLSSNSIPVTREYCV